MSSVNKPFDPVYFVQTIWFLGIVFTFCLGMLKAFIIILKEIFEHGRKS